MTNKRIINVRVTCVAFIGLMLGILFAYNWVLSRLKTWHIVVIILFVRNLQSTNLSNYPETAK